MKKIISFLIRHVPRKYLQRLSGWGLRLASIFYSGNQVQCPICQSKFKKFMPYGRINPRTNALCPRCLSLERHRLIWLYLQRKTNFFETPLDVLHIAPEQCFISRFEKTHGDQYITADLESPWAKVKMDIHHMPFGDNHFDVVLCNHVLEHVDDDIQAMREIHRVLKPGGWSILQVPFFSPVPDRTFEDKSVKDPKKREELFGQSDHVRKFGKDYGHRIAQAGLSPVADHIGQSLTEEEAYRLGISRNEILYIGQKK
ncbi:MAG: class I SAM-dependent methyltransferase [Cyclobacteriaceae bacterium]